MMHNLLAVRTYSIGGGQQQHQLKDLLQQIFLEDSLLQLSYHAVRISISNDFFTLIPQRLYHRDQHAAYLQHMVSITNDKYLRSDRLSVLDIQNVYAIHQEKHDALLRLFPNAGFYHINSALILAFHGLALRREGLNVFLNVQHRRVQILVFEDANLLFCNSFNFRHPNDFIYYVMMVFDQFQLKPEIVPVGLSGHIIEDSRIYHMLYRYIRHLYMVQPPDHLQFGKQFGDTPRHFYFDLFSLRLCE